MRKVFGIILVFVLFISAFTIFSMAAGAADGEYFHNVVLGVGATENERNITWYTTIGNEGYVRYCKTDEIVSGRMPDNSPISYSTRYDSINKIGYIINKATLKNLSPNTEYAYQLFVGEFSSELYEFKTDSEGAFDFVFVGDPQLKDDVGSEQWADTLNKIDTAFDPSLIVLSGDNIVTPDEEEQYNHFIVDAMKNTAFAPTVGPAHDSPSVSFSEHFNIPNKSDSYGVNETSANYWYIYNNVLFMHLNMSDTAAAKNGEHKAFMEETIEMNPGVRWKIVVLHNALYSAGMHSDPSYAYFESEISAYREHLAPSLTECGIDLVLSGHDHIYVRSKFMNGNVVSDICTDEGYVIDPIGTLHIAASSSTGTKFYENKVGDADYIAKLSEEKRKSAICFSITDTTLTLNSYYLDDMSVFDNFTIVKSEHIHTPEVIEYKAPTCEGYGNQEYYKCYGCGFCFKDAECVVVTTGKEMLISPIGHDYKAATCNTPKTCKNEGCGETIGKAKGHDFEKADCERPITCTVCGVTRGAPLGHEFDFDCDVDCNRDGCEYTRADIQHKDEDSNFYCDDCQAQLLSDEASDKENNSGNNKKDSRDKIIIIVAGISVLLVIVSSIVVTKKSSKK